MPQMSEMQYAAVPNCPDLFQHLPAPYFSCNAEGLITSYNEAGATLWGKHPKLYTTYWSELLQVYNANNKTVSLATTFDETPILANDGCIVKTCANTIPVKLWRVAAKLLYDTNNILLGAEYLLFDVTDLVLENEELEKARKNKRTLLNASKDLHWSINRNYELITGNKAFIAGAAAVGVYLKEGDPIISLDFGKEQYEKWKQLYDRCFNGEQFTVEYDDKDLQGNPINQEVTLNPIYEGDKVIAVGCFSRDVTVKKSQDKKILEQNEALNIKTAHLEKLTASLQKIMDSSIDVICVIDAQGRFVSASAACKLIWGWDEEALTGKNFTDFIAPGCVPVCKHLLEQIASGADIRSFETNVVRNDGTQLPVVWSAAWDKAEQIMYCIGKDASLMKDAETIRYKTEQKFLAMVEHSADIIGILDAEGKFTFISKNVEDILGHNHQFLLGKRAFDFIHPDDLPKVLEAFALVVGGDQLCISDFRFKDAYGRWTWLETTATNNLGDPFIQGIVINTRDITSRKNTELLLKQSNERYNLVSKATNDVVWDWDLTTNEHYWSENFSKLFGYPKDVEATIKDWIDKIHIEDRERVVRKFQESVEKNIEWWEDEYRFIKYDDEIAYVEDRGVLMRNENGEAIRMVGAMRDVTNKRQAEQEKASITKDLIKRNNQLEQFTYIISHNLRAPISNILGLTQESMNEDYPLELRNEFLANVLLSAQKLDEVLRDINQVLQLNSEADKRKESVHLLTLIEDIKINLASQIKEKQATICTDFTEASYLYAHRSYLFSIFYNLVLNSLKYQKLGVPPVINVSSKLEEGFVQLSFQDNGMGINLEKHKDKVFGLYKRFHPSVEGRGMGLYMTKTQVEALGGEITLTSAVDEGTTFYLSFPFASPDDDKS